MSRLLAVLVLLTLSMTASAAPAQQDRALARAMQEMREGNWAAALIDSRGDGQVALDVILWHYLRASRGDPTQIMDFISRNPDWPGMDYLREKSEIAISEAGGDVVPRFFDGYRPQTGAGALALARSYNITDSPYVHNVKVNNGQRARGLCWHWAEDMELRLRQESFRTLTVHRAIAQSFPGFEHSTSVISRRGDPMQRGIVVDPWRAGGRLFWSPVLRDDYEWRPRMEVLAEKWLKRQGGAPAP